MMTKKEKIKICEKNSKNPSKFMRGKIQKIKCANIQTRDFVFLCIHGNPNFQFSSLQKKNRKQKYRK